MHTRKRATAARIAAITALAAILAGLAGAALAQEATWTEMTLPIDEGWLGGIDKHQTRPTARRAEITRPGPTPTPATAAGALPQATTAAGSGDASATDEPYIGPAIPTGPRSTAPPAWAGTTVVTVAVVALIAVLLRVLPGGRMKMAPWMWLLVALSIAGALGVGVLMLLPAGGPPSLFVAAALAATVAACFGVALPLVAGQRGTIPPWLVVIAALAACGVLGLIVVLLFG